MGRTRAIQVVIEDERRNGLALELRADREDVVREDDLGEEVCLLAYARRNGGGCQPCGPLRQGRESNPPSEYW